jgi:hypothetical protein
MGFFKVPLLDLDCPAISMSLHAQDRPVAHAHLVENSG